MGNAIGEAIKSATEYLRTHPEEARYTDSEAIATLSSGLRVSVRASDGATVETDMPPAIGGGNAAPSPGWLLRAAAASCLTTLIAMRAAELGIEIRSLSVTVDSESDDFGILGIDPSVPAGPLSARAHVRLDASGGELSSLVTWAAEHCPVWDGLRRAVPVSIETV